MMIHEEERTEAIFYPQIELFCLLLFPEMSPPLNDRIDHKYPKFEKQNYVVVPIIKQNKTKVDLCIACGLITRVTGKHFSQVSGLWKERL